MHADARMCSYSTLQPVQSLDNACRQGYHELALSCWDQLNAVCYDAESAPASPEVHVKHLRMTVIQA